MPPGNLKRLDIHNSDVPLLCRSCEARHNGICGALKPDELLSLAKHTRRAQHPAGTELIAAGERVSSYASVMRGVVKLSKSLEDGRQQMVGLQFAPDFVGRVFGEESTVTAAAASDVELCHIPKPALERLVAAHPALENRLLRQALRELDEARDWMLTLGRKTAGEKVATFLHLLATHLDPAEQGDARSFDLPLTRADIADFLGLTVETVSRQLTRLRAEGLIAIANNRRIAIPDLHRLAARCG